MPSTVDATDDLTPRQKDVYTLLYEGARRGVQPTIREIAERLGIRSPNGVMCHIRALERRGWLAPNGNSSSRARRLLRTPDGRPIAEDDGDSARYVVIVGHPTKGERVYGPMTNRASAERVLGERRRAELGSWGHVAQLEPATW